MFIIQRYIVRETIPWFLIGVLFFEVIMLAQQIFKLVDMHVRDHVPLPDILQLFVYTIPFTTQLTIPLGVMVGTLMAVSRLSGDEEITAMRACGMSLLRIFVPSFAFGIFITLCHLAFVEWVVPWGNKNYVKTYREIMQVDPTLILMAESSLTRNDYIVQVDLVNNVERTMEMIRIIDKTNNKMILAREGEFGGKDNDKNAFPLHLRQTSTQRWHYNPREKKDEEGFWEKTNDELTLYIPDQRRKQDFDPFNVKSWAISYLNEKIQEKENDAYIDRLGQINEMCHNKVSLTFLENQYFMEFGEYPNYDAPPFGSGLPEDPNDNKEMINQGEVGRAQPPPHTPKNIRRKTPDSNQASDESASKEQGDPEDNKGADPPNEKDDPMGGDSTEGNSTEGNPSREEKAERRDSDADDDAQNGNPDDKKQRTKPDALTAEEINAAVQANNAPRVTSSGTNRRRDHISIVDQIKTKLTAVQASKDRIDRIDNRSGSELLQHYKHEFHIKVAIPFACFAFTLISAPLGIYSGRLGRSLGLVFCVVIAIVWFGIRILASVLFEEKLLSPILAAWIPNILLFIIGINLAIIKMRG